MSGEEEYSHISGYASPKCALVSLFKIISNTFTLENATFYSSPTDASLSHIFHLNKLLPFIKKKNTQLGNPTVASYKGH